MGLRLIFRILERAVGEESARISLRNSKFPPRKAARMYPRQKLTARAAMPSAPVSCSNH